MIRVIKLGGSLLTLPDWHERFLRWLATEPPAINLLVIGGGELVDVLRREHERFPYTERQMHFAALAAMEINAQLTQARLPHAKLLRTSSELQRLLPPVFDRGLKEPSTILLISIKSWWQVAADAGQTLPPETWATTSDTLAAWIAGIVSATELVLLKSTEVPVQASDWSSQAFVDPNFSCYLPQAIRCRAVNLRAL